MKQIFVVPYNLEQLKTEHRTDTQKTHAHRYTQAQTRAHTHTATHKTYAGAEVVDCLVESNCHLNLPFSLVFLGLGKTLVACL